MVELRMTADGSNTVFSDAFSETYHSVNGAVTESKHVFIDAGLKSCSKKHIRIFEVGFGTGLNALLSIIEGQKQNLVIDYHSVELYPIDMSMVEQINYSDFLSSEIKLFKSMHEASWDVPVDIVSGFRLKKMNAGIREVSLTEKYDVVFFDAFSPVVQPDLWTADIFRKLYKHTAEGGVLTTYCAKGEVRRTMVASGFTVGRLPGPPGKREMLRATKNALLPDR